jgi:hypothetical protein
VSAERFIFLEDWAYAGKTKVWAVCSHSGGEVLGEIRWFGRWRQYTFFPSAGATFNPDCLELIARWTREKTAEHREARKAIA